MNFLSKSEAIHELCKKTRKHAADITIKNKPNREEFLKRCNESKILKISDNQIKNYNELWDAIESSWEIIFGNKEEIEELLRIFEEAKGENFIYYSPEKTFIRVLLLEEDQYETF